MVDKVNDEIKMKAKLSIEYVMLQEWEIALEAGRRERRCCGA